MSFTNEALGVLNTAESATKQSLKLQEPSAKINSNVAGPSKATQALTQTLSEMMAQKARVDARKQLLTGGTE